MFSSDAKICVLGLGYIGLPTAALLATKGYTVHGVDVTDEVVDTINRGEIHIYEPDLDILVKSAVHSGRLTAGREPQNAEIFVVAVPTPFADGHAPDVSYVEAATRTLAPYLEPGNLVILESTSPVGTTEKMAEWIRELRSDLTLPRRRARQTTADAKTRVHIAHCPERVLPGQILRELVGNDRIVGGVDRSSTEVATEFYKTFAAGKVFSTDSRTAELAKLTENAFRDVNIAFANELSIISDGLDINVWELIDLANRHPRVSILKPGPGVGGHCIAVDPWFIVHAAGDRAPLLRTAREVNDSKPDYILRKIENRAARLRDPKIACFGLAFKANVGDLRESPALDIVERLAAARIGEISVVEPHVPELPESLREAGVAFVDIDAALQSADIIVGLVDHDEFSDIDVGLLKERIVIDTRGMWR